MSRFVSKNRKDVMDLSGEERAIWEAEQLSSSLDLQSIPIDAAPFQLVENTSILKIHSVFSLMGLRRAYVTKLGRLVGVVSLREVRNCQNRSYLRAVSGRNDGMDSLLRTEIEDINHASAHGSIKSVDS
ncbi:hypothetical protein OSTOST_19668 [Ostertagia ostertagi]